MEILKEILRIVTSKSEVPKVLPELDDDADPEIRDSLTAQFLHGLNEDRYEDDEHAAVELYGTGKSDQRYRTLKSRVFERLLHSILFLQVKQPEHSEYLSYYYKCTRNLICAQSLMRFASRTAGFHVAQKTLTIAQKYQFTDICLTLSVLLRESAGFWGQKKKFNHYNALVKKYFRVLEAEYRSDELLDLHAIENSYTSRTKAFLLNLGDEILEEIQALEEEFQSHLLKLNVFRHRINLAHTSGNPHDMIVTCDDAIQYLTSNPHLSQPARLGEFRLRKMMMQLIVRKSAAAFEEADAVVESFRLGGNNWYIALTYATAAAFHEQKFDAAERFIEQAVSHRKFQLLGELQVETWIVYDAYIHLAVRLGLYTSSRPEKQKSFRLSTYLNSVPEESKVKKVANVLILISHAFFLILDGEFDAAERRIEYLKVYGSRYLKEKHYSRVRIFIRLLQSVPRNSFLADEVRRSNKDLYEQLLLTREEQMPSTLNEFIPFETLYNSLLDFLERYEEEVEAV